MKRSIAVISYIAVGSLAIGPPVGAGEQPPNSLPPSPDIWRVPQDGEIVPEVKSVHAAYRVLSKSDIEAAGYQNVNLIVVEVLKDDRDRKEPVIDRSSAGTIIIWADKMDETETSLPGNAWKENPVIEIDKTFGTISRAIGSTTLQIVDPELVGSEEWVLNRPVPEQLLRKEMAFEEVLLLLKDEFGLYIPGEFGIEEGFTFLCPCNELNVLRLDGTETIVVRDLVLAVLNTYVEFQKSRFAEHGQELFRFRISPTKALDPNVQFGIFVL